MPGPGTPSWDPTTPSAPSTRSWRARYGPESSTSCTRSWAEPLAPNVLVVLLDDTGFAQLGCFGSDIATPHIDALAGRGLRYNRFHVTAMCSPTRASLLTGRNHHAVG
ncbi:MAG TPA: sulfatase-like hydrolase/transferase, partial [Acidimicrobiales bacterium]|nr:sulfatase-like hydrolase/transferase [Acidimicrobiales bacterium]